MKPLAFAVVVVSAFTTLWSSPASAHGGEDHGAPPPPPVANDSGVRTASAVTSSVELVARWPAQTAGAPLLLRVLLSDFASNAPIEGADVTLDVTQPNGAPLSSSSMKATPSPGIYEVSLTPSLDGVHAASITVVAGELVDVVALQALPLGPPTTPAEAPHEHTALSVPLVLGVLLTALGAAALLVFFVLRRRRLATAALSTTALLIAALASFDVHAHGGEDHGAPAPAATSTSASTPASTSVVVLLKESQFLLGIRTATVELSPVKDRLEVPGVVTAPPERHAAVFAPQQGRVIIGDGGKSVPLLGSVVKKGQTLAILEAALSVGERASFSVEAAQSESEVTAARSRLAAAQKNLARVTGLEGVVSQRDRDAAAVEVEQAQASLTAAEGKRSAYGASSQATRIVLQSPISGILADVDVSPGEIVEPGRRAFLIVDPAELWVEAKVYEADLARMTPGASANIDVDAWPGQTFPGALLALGEVVDPDTRTVKAIFRVDNPASATGIGRPLKLGMFAHVQIGAGAATDVLVVPESAVLDVDGRDVVFVHIAPELFERKEVALGRRDGSRVEVRAGVLKAGDRVVTSGLLTLKNAPPAPATAPTATTKTTTKTPTTTPTTTTKAEK